MPNYRRNIAAGGTFFFTVVTHQRQAFLTTELARTCLRRGIQHVRKRRPFTINAIVLLPDHLHCIWALPEGDDDYSYRWSRIKARFSQFYSACGGLESKISSSRAKRGERGFWQRRFYEHTIRDADDLKRCINYIHINPLKHSLVDHVSDWPWSSFHRYVRLGEYTNDWGNAPEYYGDEWLSME